MEVIGHLLQKEDTKVMSDLVYWSPPSERVIYLIITQVKTPRSEDKNVHKKMESVHRAYSTPGERKSCKQISDLVRLMQDVNVHYVAVPSVNCVSFCLNPR